MKKTSNSAIFTEAEREAWRLPDPQTVSEWADANRVLDSKTSAEPGQWRTARTPYLREPMDAFTDPWTEEITLMWSTQIGKTEGGLYNLIAYTIDQDPGPSMLVMPREDDAKTVSRNRIQPMIQISPTLARHMTGLGDDFSAMEMRLDRMTLYLAGANSPAALASKPICKLFMDEVDKFPPYSGREADPIKLARERIRTYKAQGSARVVKVSTPTTRNGYIFREYQASDRRRFFLPCPHCGSWNPLVFGQMRWPEDATIEEIEQNRLAWLECQTCKGRIEDRHKARMLDHGVWVPDGAEIQPDGTVTGGPSRSSHRGYWLCALYSPWLTFGEIAAEFLRSKNHPELLMNFINSWLAEIWEEKSHETTPDAMRQRESEHASGEVPAGGLVLTAGVDVQKDYYVFTIRAWGYNESSWLVRWGIVHSWEEVDAVLFKTSYARVSDGHPMTVRLACIDSGHNAHEVYQFCRDRRERARPIKGQDHLTGGQVYKPATIDTLQLNGKTIRIPGGLQLYHLDTCYLKDKLARLMTAPLTAPTQWRLYSGIDDEYLNQVCAEEKVRERNRKTGREIEFWKTKAIGGANHVWDTEVYSLAAAEMMRVWSLRPSDQPVQPYQSPQHTKPASSFVHRGQAPARGGWMKR